MPVWNVYKPIGWTPLETVRALQNEEPSLNGAPVAYAGRLDPLADGVLILLSGADTRKREMFERLPKEYVCEAVFGVETDTYDSMGLPRAVDGPIPKQDQVAGLLYAFTGVFHQPYPPYSSARVRGKPLFWWAREGRLAEIEIPGKMVRVDSISINAWGSVAPELWMKECQDKITRVQGSFRQKEILGEWKVVTASRKEPFPRVTMHVSCSSGMYVRSLIHELGRKLGCGATTARITRTRVGGYRIEEARRISARP